MATESFALFHLCSAQRRATPLGVEGGKTGDGWGRGPWIPWLIQGGVEGSRIVPSITCPEIPGRTFFPFLSSSHDPNRYEHRTHRQGGVYPSGLHFADEGAEKPYDNQRKPQ